MSRPTFPFTKLQSNLDITYEAEIWYAVSTHKNKIIQVVLDGLVWLVFLSHEGSNYENKIIKGFGRNVFFKFGLVSLVFLSHITITGENISQTCRHSSQKYVNLRGLDGWVVLIKFEIHLRHYLGNLNFACRLNSQK